MESTAQNGTLLAKIVETEKDFARLQQHLKEVIEGEAFKGSHRSGQFLSYIVEESIAGRFAALKERVIGVKLFGRSPSYDTGEDAIVRVTASDVRRRLLQHYGKYGITSEFRISLPLGSYIPEITREPQKTANLPDPVPAVEVPVTTAEPVPEPHIVRPVETPPGWKQMAAFRCSGHRMQCCHVGNFLESFFSTSRRAGFHPSVVSIFSVSASHQTDNQ
jgi:hypothetical protein